MKKLTLISAAAIALFALASCDNSKKQPVSYETPIFDSLAAKYEVSTKDGNTGEIKTLEITETGLYVIVAKDGQEILDGKVKESAKELANQAVKKLTLEGYGTVEIKELKASSVELTFTKGGDTFTVTAEPQNTNGAVGGTMGGRTFRTWIITNTTISVSGGDLPSVLGVAKNFKGCKLTEIKDYLEDKSGQKIKIEEDLKGYEVKDISLTRAGSFIVRFTGKPTFYADFKIAKDGKFDYKLTGTQNGNPIFNGEAKGAVTYDELGNASVVLEAVAVDKDNTDYQGKVVFLLEQVK